MLRAEGNSTQFQKAEVWHGNQGAKGEIRQAFVPAEIVYGDSGSSRSATPAMRPEQGSSLAVPAELGAPHSDVTSPGFVKSNNFKSAIPQQFANTGDLADAQRLTDQASDVLTRLRSPNSPPRIEAALAGQIEHQGAPRELASLPTPAQGDGAAPSNPLAVATLAPAPHELQSLTAADSSTQSGDKANTASQMESTSAQETSPNQYVVYNSTQQREKPDTAVPSLTVNFDLSNGPALERSEDALTWSRDSDQRAASSQPGSAVAATRSESTATLIQYFTGGLILGMGAFCGALVVFSKLMTPQPVYQQIPFPVPAPFPTAAHTEPPASEFSPKSEARSTPRKARSKSAESAAPTSPETAVVKVRRSAQSNKARSTQASSGEEKATGILEGIFQENLRLQGQIDLTSEGV